MRFVVFTLFPEMLAPLRESILQRAQEAGLIEIRLVNFRDYALSKHKNVDDEPYGGGAGMLLKPEPLFAAVRALPESPGASGRRIVLLSPQGRVFSQRVAVELSCYEELVFLCGHYEGFDERIRALADEEVSLGDFVLTGGELAAAAMIDAIARLVPGVLGQSASLQEESYAAGVLEYPQYTRPEDFGGRQVPEVLLSGHHARIARWRRKESLRRTFLRRPDLWERLVFTAEDYSVLEELAGEIPALGEWRDRWRDLAPRPKTRKKKNSSGGRGEPGRTSGHWP
ncbi:carnosine N-methyltransferase/tRNA (guanine37-N1)-methyltransferase [Acididesulfobacillus acetoxydans]|uniref:tRNA (guanine-N(1)-)-methyltransferase n=1 Tax=Acididesulfobacillus acetoxydans TaxID=1561005 RepID=A0A8S0X0Q5_9FIRM|nr:tRNA (guanosine(37)-N1)-methyltransferase TrmD [Acididesulfobacillus acetoxydans]CAA7602711.1 carnosine N-methyltransferase/tRNA (guanine37-N1)-methyltransferase [Acididesulfobacillus acetoxydans]CEJ06432.1 tRNA (guanine-N(1)-)-methyltransferase [Acididesulfobacillus acetoxydans]